MIYFIYGITDCPACLRACADLMECDKEYVFVETDFAPTHRAYLKAYYSHPTFPIIVRLEEGEQAVIGGYEELQDHLREDSLDKNFTCPLD